MKNKKLIFTVNVMLVLAIICPLFTSCDRMSHNKHIKEQKVDAQARAACPDCTPLGCMHESCHNQFCQEHIRGCHAITELELLNKVTRFTGGLIPEPKVVTASEIQSLIDQIDCNNPRKIDFCGNFANKNSNADITIGFDDNPSSCTIYDTCLVKTTDCPDRIAAIENKAMDVARYTKALFQGIMLLDPVEFHFYKAISEQYCQGCNKCEKHDIVFVAVSQSGQVEYVGDLSDLFP